METSEIIRTKLIAALSPLRLEIIDESHNHVGHAGAPSGGQSHFQVEIVSQAFAGCSRLQRQRMVYDVLSDELAGPVHALSLITLAPGESAARSDS